MSALDKVDQSLLSSVNRQLVAKGADFLGPLADIANMGWQAAEGNYYGAASSLIALGAGIAIAAGLAAAGIVGIPAVLLVVGLGMGVEALANFLFDYFDPFGINSDVNTHFDLALKTASPIVLDLDGDGIETFGAHGQVLFDHDGDGNKHGTGWVKSDDGLLVLDRNGNGTIDSGLELFGENTLLANGQKARDGFEAMQAVDGNGDGKLDASDAVWADLRVWRDLNGDGISQGGELFTLEELGIKSINTGSDGKLQNLGNNNHIDGFSTFEWDESRGGGTGVSGDVYFEDNQFYRKFGDRIEIPETLRGLPDMQGSGAVRDLREAAVGSQKLQDLLTSYAQAETSTAQKALLEQVVSAWSETAEFRTFDQRIGDLGNGTPYNFAFAYSWTVHGSDAMGSGGSGGGSATMGNAGNNSGLTVTQLERKELLEKIKVLEVFNNQYFFSFDAPTITSSGQTSLNHKAGAQQRSGVALAAVLGGTTYITESSFSFGPQQMAGIRSAYQALLDSVYEGLLLQTRLKPYVDAIGLTLGVDGVELDYSGITEILEQVAEQNVAKAVSDLFDLQKHQAFNGSLLADFVSISLLNWVEKLSPAEQQQLQGEFGPTLLLGSAAADHLTGTAQNDQLYGGAGDDLLDGGSGSNRLYGGSGNDVLKVSTSARDNLFVGDTGDDTLYGSNHSDTYLFNLGDGVDTIIETGSNSGAVDVLHFGEGIAAEHLWLGRSGNDLQVQLLGSEDQVIIRDWYRGTVNQLEQFQLDDGRALNFKQVNNLVDAMAAFGSPDGGELDLSVPQREQLDLLISANWQ
ncbi:hypothetical protein NCCP436_02570 [Pseudomonas sp. NCCP-436]|nr:hypothetical protein NCCP436_02570 [Pseudomonas sp. NCCP-436]